MTRDMLRQIGNSVQTLTQIVHPYNAARVTEVFAEIPVSTVSDSNARVSQVFVEAPVSTVSDSNARVTQVFVEVPVA